MKPYMGYTAKVDYDPDDGLLVGRVENIRDVVTFYANDTVTLEREFHESVDEYIAFCLERGAEPERPYSGRILFRCGGELHKAVAAAARAEGSSVNSWLLEAVRRRLAEESTSGVASPLAGTLLAGFPMVHSEQQSVRVHMAARPRMITPAIRVQAVGQGGPN